MKVLRKKSIILVVISLWVSNLYAISQIKVICDRDGQEIYLNGKFKTECDNREPSAIIVKEGKYSIEVKKDNGDGSYYHYQKTFRIGDSVQKIIEVSSVDKLLKREAILDGVGLNDNNFLVVWYKERNFHKIGQDEEYVDGWIAKYNINGEKIWEKSFGKDENMKRCNIFNSIIHTKDGGFVIGGFKTSSISTRDESTTFWLIKIDKDGNKIWEKVLNDKNSVSEISDIIEIPDNNFFIVGLKNYKTFISKIDGKNGNLYAVIVQKKVVIVLYGLLS